MKAVHRLHLNRVPLLVLALCTACLLFFLSCQPETDPLEIDEALLTGYWQAQDNMQEYWRFDSDHKGETWDESEDVQEGEGAHYSWESVHDQLRIDIVGEMGEHVYYDYTVTKQTQFQFTWEDLYGNHRTFIKKLR